MIPRPAGRAAAAWGREVRSVTGAPLQSIPGVCDVETYGAPGAGRVDLLLEIPHGATTAADFEALCARLVSPLPEDLAAFYWVNTDVGAPEVARAVAARVAAAGGRVLVLRSRVPRTFVDCNRALAPPSDVVRDGLTPAVPGYVRDPRDVELLGSLHRAWAGAAERAYDAVCGGGGLAIQLHTYAPLEVEIDRVDDDVVRALRRAWSSEQVGRWRRRPDVDLIRDEADGTSHAPAAFAEAVRAAYAAAGFGVGVNATYALHPATAGWALSHRHPGRVLCLELNRAALAEPFIPFEPMRIPVPRAERMARPLAEAWAATRGDASRA